ncbi:chemotaxis protein CheD [Vibrio sp. SCSIO 43137]|uniref:chemotaxis protein CheD n=1 Tax=Vibrio sp. SCSIO 43137 TaxID=3021011 RepID=UPI0023080BD4|nr:chemotaxis protein CheD [Vibrio sp. SCSIO 43137]WCE31361.1 chemotaxis protein CheD [Vibrio sp. SCSIO 43137]
MFVTTPERTFHRSNSNFRRFFHKTQQKHMVKILPGGLYSTHEDELIVTGLGSCIAACIWDENLAIGGMNHFLLPFHTQSKLSSWKPNEYASIPSRYGSHAMELLINALLNEGARRENLKVKLFGGAQMMGRHSMVGEKNIAFVTNYVEREQLNVVAHDLGGIEPRKIVFEPVSGRAWLKRIPFTEIRHVQQEEDKYASKLDKESHSNHDDDVELF